MLAGTWPGAGCPGGAEAAGNPGEHTVEVTRMVPETAPVKVTVVVGTDGVGCELTCAAVPGAFVPGGAAGTGRRGPGGAARGGLAANSPAPPVPGRSSRGALQVRGRRDPGVPLAPRPLRQWQRPRRVSRSPTRRTR